MSSAGKDDLACLRVGLSSIDSRGTLVGGPPPSSSSSRQCHDISNFPGAQGSLSKVDSNTLMIKKVQKEHVPETESDCKTRSNFRALFYRVSRAFGCDQNVHVALVTRGARRSTRNLPYVTITHSYVLAFFATRFLLLFRSHFCRNCSFTRRYQHDSVLELFLHFGRRTKPIPPLSFSLPLSPSLSLSLSLSRFTDFNQACFHYTEQKGKRKEECAREALPLPLSFNRRRAIKMISLWKNFIKMSCWRPKLNQDRQKKKRTHRWACTSKENTVRVSVLASAPNDTTQPRLMERAWIVQLSSPASPWHLINRDRGIDALTLD